jgi:iron complex outermembrane recepter protein
VTQLQATPALLTQYGLSDDYLDYDLVTKSNFGNAAITGIEMSWRQSLSVISPFARGLQVYANATKMKLSGNNAADFTPFTPLTFNGGISYIRHKLSIKYNLNWSDEVTGARVAPSASVPAGTFQYVAPKTTADLSVDFQVFKHFIIYASVRNLTASAKRTMRAAPGTPQFARPVNYQNYGTLVTIGLREEF